MKSKWYGIPPKKCDICGCSLTGYKSFVDGRTKNGRWAIMCELCYVKHGVGLGVGKGQKYEMKVIKDGDKEWIKIKKSN